jgi:hypothetical protein
MRYSATFTDKAERDALAAKLEAKGATVTTSDKNRFVVYDESARLTAVLDDEPDEKGYEDTNKERKIVAAAEYYSLESDVMP